GGGGWGHVARVDGDRAPRQQGHAERADRAARRIREGQLTEENEARILVEQVLDAARVGGGPGLDRLHRRLAELELAALDEEAPDRLERVAVLVGITDAQRLAARELDSSGALNLEEERLDRII